MKERGYIKKTNLGYNEIYVKGESQRFCEINSNAQSTSRIMDNFYKHPDDECIFQRQRFLQF